MDEQIEQIADAIVAALGPQAGILFTARNANIAARAAHSVMAGTIAEHRAAAEMLFKRLEHLRDMSGTENRLERGNHAAFNTALEIARATLAALAPPRHD